MLTSLPQNSPVHAPGFLNACFGSGRLQNGQATEKALAAAIASPIARVNPRSTKLRISLHQLPRPFAAVRAAQREPKAHEACHVLAGINIRERKLEIQPDEQRKRDGNDPHGQEVDDRRCTRIPAASEAKSPFPLTG